MPSSTSSNDDLKLKPGMTATVSVVTDRRRDVLAIPNAALRFRPEVASGGQGGPRASQAGAGGAQNPGGGAGAGGARQRGQGGQGENNGGGRRDREGDNEEGGVPEVVKRTVYVLEAGKPTPREVTTGITDGRVTEIIGGELKEGDDVIVSVAGQNPNQQQRGQGQRGFRIL